MACENNTRSSKSCKCANGWHYKRLNPRIKKNHPPFNTSTTLRKNLGLHPKLFPVTQDSPAVGLYNPSRISCRKNTRDWQRDEELKEFSATMGGHLLEKYVFERNLQKTGRGPGTHEISQWPDNILDRSCKTIKANVGFGITPRFKKDARKNMPGPGYLSDLFRFKNHNRFKKHSSLPTFEFDGLRSRFQKSLHSWSLPCNLYNPRHPDCLDNLLSKVVSKRGPYDLFTGCRDYTSVKGYLAMPSTIYNKDWPMGFSGEIDKLLHKSNYFKGLWTHCPRFTKKPFTRIMLNDPSLCYKDPDQPGPGYYEPQQISKPKNALRYPFDSNILNVRPLRCKEICPGPGRYPTKVPKNIKGNGWSWVFKSKAPRTIVANARQPYNDF
ncbi:uncharacterized protein LOC112494435 [Cephus cinctus]|uniref:Uncharacterized protein LOC112494435 n=1 Tax=Cephus cinctus TaxID=211228 RepID=A0AAJ7RI56_CEPCN|nr:uncharacterized protein LOC112494435 [Cephus cinctus]